MTTSDQQEMTAKEMVINCCKKLSSHYVEKFRTQIVCDDRVTDGHQETFFIAILIDVYTVSTPLCV
jgi:hypothetical protein